MRKCSPCSSRRAHAEPVDLSFDATTIAWRGPAPFVFARVPEDESDQIAEVASLVTYGWGAIPVVARIEGVEFTTSLFPGTASIWCP